MAELVLARSRLVDRIRSTPAGGVCLLVSDPGYGRSTLVRAATGADAQTVALGGSALDAAALRERLAEAWGSAPGGWLVVEDVDASLHAEAGELLADLARSCPADRRIVVTTSSPLEDAFDRQRAGGLLVQLDQEALALGRDESLELLEGLAPGLPPQERSEAAELCDGWLAALVTVARRHAEHPDRDVLTWLRTHGAELLLGRWLAAQDDAVRDMLLQTAILERLTPALVDEVTGGDVGRCLASLARPRGAIRVAAAGDDDRHVWFERHPLLTMLVRYLGGGRDGQERHRRAADWYRRSGDLAQELVHLLAAGDAEAAVARFHQIEDELLLSGRADQALRWFEEMPVPQAAEHLLRVAWSHALANRLTEARQTIYRLHGLMEVRSGSDPSPHPALDDVAAEVHVLDAWIAERTGDMHSTVRSADKARAVFGPSWSRNSHQLATLLAARGRLLLGAVVEAEAILASVRENPFTTAVLGEGRRADTEAAAAWSAGNVNRARVWASRHDRWLRAQHPQRMHSRYAPSVTGFLCLAEQGHYDDAVSGVTGSGEMAATYGATTEHVVALLALAHLHRMQWRLPLAWEQASRARAVILESSPDGGLLPLATECQVRVRLMSGDHVRAERLIRTMPASTSRQLLSARLALVRGASYGLTLVREVEPTTVRVDVERGVLSAWAHAASSRQRAEQELLRAADVAGQYGITTALVDVPDSLLDVAHRAAAYHVHESLTSLVQTAVDARSAARVSAPVPSDLVLTRGELELLALLPTRATYARMAERLGVSINTVKTRLRRLYAKLGAHDRETAIAQAARLGLLARR